MAKNIDSGGIMFFSPFEAGLSGWRWCHKFLKDYPEMNIRVCHDCFAAMPGLVIA